MIKKLDILILKAFIGPFIATFFITLFVLVMQFFWLYIDDIVGKGLDMLTLSKFILYVSSTLVPLALPLAVLLSSIMTFGNLGETFELVAIKSAGIHLLRFMRPLFLATICICGLAFLFNNNIIPIAKLKMETMKYDIVTGKPAFDIKEGVFYDKLDGFVIKIGKKEADGSNIKEVVIYEKNYGLQDNVIIAESGKMEVGSDKRFLKFILYNGTMYQEQGNKGSSETEYIRMSFKSYTKEFDLSSFQLLKTDDSTYKDRHSMLNMAQLEQRIDSLGKVYDFFKTKAKQEVFQYNKFTRLIDSTWTPLPSAATKNIPANIDELIPEEQRRYVVERAASQATSIKNMLNMTTYDYEGRIKEYRNHLIEWHTKITMSIACLVMFLIGAPLGSIIRKGGLGAPLVFAVIFFVIFFLLNNFGNKFVKEGVTYAWFGIWLATYILTPIGLFLIYKAMHDSQLLNKEFYYRTFSKIKKFYRRVREKQQLAKIK